MSPKYVELIGLEYMYSRPNSYTQPSDVHTCTYLLNGVHSTKGSHICHVPLRWGMRSSQGIGTKSEATQAKANTCPCCNAATGWRWRMTKEPQCDRIELQLRVWITIGWCNDLYK